jgi:hypothetical protein
MAAASRYPSCSGNSSYRSPQMISVGAVIVPDSDGWSSAVLWVDLPPAHVGIHTGPVISQDGDVYGRAVNLAARIASYAHGGQVVVSPRRRSTPATPRCGSTRSEPSSSKASPSLCRSTRPTAGLRGRTSDSAIAQGETLLTPARAQSSSSPSHRYRGLTRWSAVDCRPG